MHGLWGSPRRFFILGYRLQFFGIRSYAVNQQLTLVGTENIGGAIAGVSGQIR